MNIITISREFGSGGGRWASTWQNIWGMIIMTA